MLIMREGQSGQKYIVPTKKTQFKTNGIGRLKIKRWKKMCNADNNQKKAVVF